VSSNRTSEKIVPLPVLHGGTIDDTLSGFAPQIDQNAHLGRRVEHALSVLAVELRGWRQIADKVGHETAERLRADAIDRIVEVLDALSGEDVMVRGTPQTPVVTAAFSGEQHAMRALVAAQGARDAASRTIHPSMPERFHACVGVNSGLVVETHVNGSGLTFNASGTIRQFAVRLQEFAGPDQVFLSASTLAAVPARLDVVPIGTVRTNGDGQAEEAFSLRGLLPDGAVPG